MKEILKSFFLKFFPFHYSGFIVSQWPFQKGKDEKLTTTILNSSIKYYGVKYQIRKIITLFFILPYMEIFSLINTINVIHRKFHTDNITNLERYFQDTEFLQTDKCVKVKTSTICNKNSYYSSWLAGFMQDY